MKKTHKGVLVILLTAYILSGCAYYKYTENVTKYKYQPTPAYKWNNLDADYILVLHSGSNIMEIKNYTFNSIMDSVTIFLQPFDGKPRYYYDNILEDKNWKSQRPPGREYKQATRQIHLFLAKSDTTQTDSLKIALTDISQVDMVGKAADVPLIVVGSALGLFVGVPLLVFAIVCGCPHVYIENGNGLELSNSLYTGATALQLERYDYKLLPDYHPGSTKFSITIANELNENHYTNLIELISVLHAPDVEVIADQNGQLHTVENPVPPVSAFNNNNKNILNELELKDDFSYSFDPDSLNDLGEAYLNFSIPANQLNGKLILRLRNSPWAGYAFNEMTSLFGKNYTDWIERNKNKSKEEREKWLREQGLQMLVDIKTEQGWKQIDQINIVGEISFNSIVIPVEFPANQKTVEIRLRAAFMFWDLDYVAMDYSADQTLNVQVLKPSGATGPNNENFIQELSYDDNLYMENLVNNTTTTILFDSLNTDPVLTRTLILGGKGYYTTNTNYTGKTYWKELMAFRKPGELSRFSYKLYNEAKAQITQK